MSGATLLAWLERAAGFPGTGIRLVDRRERERFLAWPEVAERSERVAGGLQAAGLESGERVALVYSTGVAFFAAFFGTVMAGGVPVPLYPPVRLGRLTEYQRRTGAMLRAAGTAILLTEGRLLPLLAAAAERGAPRLGSHTLERLPPGRWRRPAVAAEDLALLQFSSGTTTAPKPVALSHRAVTWQAETLNRLWPDAEGVVHAGVSWLPLYHDMGLIGCVLPALERPAVLNLLAPQDFVARPALWLRAVSHYRGTVSPAPNFAFGLAVERIRDEELEGIDLSSWRFALNGAEPVAASVLAAFARRFARWGLREEALTPVYGLSEAALAVTFSALARPFLSRRFDRRSLAEGEARPDPGGRELVSVGRPLPGFRVEVRDGTGRRLPEGRVGGVWVSGPSLMRGYLGRPAATARVLRDGWLDTGDLGFLADGELFLSGRAKDVLILRGRNHAPEEVEEVVSAVPGVRTGCVVAVGWQPEDAASEQLLVLAEHRRGAAPEVRQGLAAEVTREVVAATGLRPDRVEILAPGTLPRTSSGKLRRRAALARFAAGTLEPPRRGAALRAVTGAHLGWLAGMLPGGGER